MISSSISFCSRPCTLSAREVELERQLRVAESAIRALRFQLEKTRVTSISRLHRLQIAKSTLNKFRDQ
jgi:hypothetical protein